MGKSDFKTKLTYLGRIVENFNSIKKYLGLSGNFGINIEIAKLSSKDKTNLIPFLFMQLKGILFKAPLFKQTNYNHFDFAFIKKTQYGNYPGQKV